MILSFLSLAGEHIRFESLGLSPIALDMGFFQLRWYSLAYLTGILGGYWYLSKLIKQPGAPMAQRHADDMILYATLGIILGGRIGYVIFYQPDMIQDPIRILRLWEGGMSFHGGLIGVLIAIGYLCRRNGLSYVRVGDYIACCAPIGQFLGRLANFVNGELWGRPTDVSWAMIFPSDPLGLPRHPSQLYEAVGEGLLLFILLWFLFWKTDARRHPGLLAGVFILGFGVARFIIEFFRNPDAQLVEFAARTGLNMGQWLTIPMILVGLYLVLTARRRTAKPLSA